MVFGGERRNGWVFGVVWWWESGSGVVGAVVEKEKEKEGLEGVLRGGVYGGGCWGFVSEELENLKMGEMRVRRTCWVLLLDEMSDLCVIV